MTATETLRTPYGGYYDAEWHLKRARSLNDWSKRYGGVPLMCVEFGCLDSVTAEKCSPGARVRACLPPTAIRLIRDLRKSFEAYAIGWTYWSL